MNDSILSSTGIKLRIVQSASLELAVLVMLDQVVIGIAGKCQGIETQGVHRRL